MDRDAQSPKAEGQEMKLLNPTNYTRVSNDIVWDKRLSFKAKGLYLYLCSMPSDCCINSRQLLSAGLDAHHAISSAIDELVRRGYVREQKLVAAPGHFYVPVKK